MYNYTGCQNIWYYFHMQIKRIKVDNSSATFSIVNELLINKYRPYFNA